jgi:probable HAF family extracellular repeat protein
MHHRLLRNFLLGLVGVIVIAVGVSLFTATTAAPRFYYSVTALGTLNNYPLTLPLRINNSGQVVGMSQTTNRLKEHAFSWQNGNMTDLGTLGGDKSRAFDVNNAGQVVGKSLTSSGLYHAVLWQNGTMTDLGTHGSDNSSIATDINNSGQVVGASYPASSYQPDGSQYSKHALLWQNSGVTELGTLNGDSNSFALNITNNQQIFGVSYNTNATPSHVLKWQNGAITNLGNLGLLSGSTSSSINEINNKGQAVGSSFGSTSSGTSLQAVLWQNSTLTNLGNFGGTTSEAIDINQVGTVVGYSSSSSGTVQAFVWRNGIMRNLNNLLPLNSGWELTVASGINDKGQIVGHGKFNGQDRGFLLTPVTVSN